MSSRLATPPDAITGRRTALAISAMRSASTPACAPSRAMSVTIAAATPAARNRSAASTSGELAGLHPSFDGEPPVANVERAEDPAGKLGTGAPDQRGIEQRGRSDRHAIGAARERRAHRLDCAQSAAYVDRAVDRGANLRDRLEVARRAGNRAVEVHNVDKLARPPPRRRATSPPGRRRRRSPGSCRRAAGARLAPPFRSIEGMTVNFSNKRLSC